MEAGEVALGCLVVAGCEAAPRLDLVDAAFDAVAIFVEFGVVEDGPPAPAALLLAVRGLVGLLRDDRLDIPFPQVSAVGAGGVRLVAGDRVGPGARAADRATDLDLVQDRDGPGAVGGLSLGQDEGERAAARIGSEMDLAGQTAA